MPNDIFNIVVSELKDQLGDILAVGITKKALQKVVASENSVTEREMIRAMDMHIKPVLHSFMTPDKSTECILRIKKRIGRTHNA